MAGVSRTNLEGYYPTLAGNVASQWGFDVMASCDDKLHMTETSNVQTVQGPVVFSKTGSIHTFASPLNVSATSINTFSGPINATINCALTAVNTFGGPFNVTNTSVSTFSSPFNSVATGTNTWAGPMDFNSTIDVQGIANFQTGGAFGSLLTCNSVKLVNTIQEFSIDTTLVGNSDTAVPTEKAVKTYADLRALWNSDNSPAVTRYKSFSAADLAANTLKVGVGGTFYFGTFDIGHAQSNDSGLGYMGVKLPHGATVTALRVYGQTIDAQEAMDVKLYRYTYSTNSSSEMASVDLPTSYAEVSDESISTPTIDNDTYTYYLKFNHSAHDNDYVQVRNVQIDYTVVRPQP